MKAVDLAPGPDLDVLFLEKVEGFPARKTFLTEYSTDPHYIPSGKPRRTHLIDARPVPRFSRDDSVALAALKRFAERPDITWNICYHDGAMYYVAIYKGRTDVWMKSATSLALAVVLAILAAVEVPNE